MELISVLLLFIVLFLFLLLVAFWRITRFFTKGATDVNKFTKSLIVTLGGILAAQASRKLLKKLLR